MFEADVKLKTLPVAESASGSGIIFAGTGVTVTSGVAAGGEVTAELCPHLSETKDVIMMIRMMPDRRNAVECFFKVIHPFFDVMLIQVPLSAYVNTAELDILFSR